MACVCSGAGGSGGGGISMTGAGAAVVAFPFSLAFLASARLFACSSRLRSAFALLTSSAFGLPAATFLGEFRFSFELLAPSGLLWAAPAPVVAATLFGLPLPSFLTDDSSLMGLPTVRSLKTAGFSGWLVVVVVVIVVGMRMGAGGFPARAASAACSSSSRDFLFRLGLAN